MSILRLASNSTYVDFWLCSLRLPVHVAPVTIRYSMCSISNKLAKCLKFYSLILTNYLDIYELTLNVFLRYRPDSNRAIPWVTVRNSGPTELRYHLVQYIFLYFIYIKIGFEHQLLDWTISRIQTYKPFQTWVSVAWAGVEHRYNWVMGPIWFIYPFHSHAIKWVFHPMWHDFYLRLNIIHIDEHLLVPLLSIHLWSRKDLNLRPWHYECPATKTTELRDHLYVSPYCHQSRMHAVLSPFGSAHPNPELTYSNRWIVFIIIVLPTRFELVTSPWCVIEDINLSKFLLLRQLIV